MLWMAFCAQILVEKTINAQPVNKPSRQNKCNAKQSITAYVCSTCCASVTWGRDTIAAFNACQEGVCWSNSVTNSHLITRRAVTNVDWSGVASQEQGKSPISANYCIPVRRDERLTGLELCGVSSCLGNKYHNIEMMRYDVNIAVFNTMPYIVPTLLFIITTNYLCFDQYPLSTPSSLQLCQTMKTTRRRRILWMILAAYRWTLYDLPLATHNPHTHITLVQFFNYHFCTFLVIAAI